MGINLAQKIRLFQRSPSFEELSQLQFNPQNLLDRRHRIRDCFIGLFWIPEIVKIALLTAYIALDGMPDSKTEFSI